MRARTRKRVRRGAGTILQRSPLKSVTPRCTKRDNKPGLGQMAKELDLVSSKTRLLANAWVSDMRQLVVGVRRFRFLHGNARGTRVRRTWIGISATPRKRSDVASFASVN